jgi:copper resistance protein D
VIRQRNAMIGDDPGLVGVRAVHFAATALVAGGTCFWFLIAKPAFAAASADNTPMARGYRVKLARMIGAGLGFCVLSGVAWLLLLAANVSGQKLTDVFAEDTGWVLLTETRFGSAWIARLAAAALGGTASVRDLHPRLLVGLPAHSENLVWG